MRMRVWDVGGLSDALVTVLDDISSSHAMTRIKSIIKCIIPKPGYNGNKQLESRGRPGLSGGKNSHDTGGGRGLAAGMMDHHLCDGHNAGKDCNVSTRYLIRSVADVHKKIPIQSQPDFYNVRM